MLKNLLLLLKSHPKPIIIHDTNGNIYLYPLFIIENRTKNTFII